MKAKSIALVFALVAQTTVFGAHVLSKGDSTQKHATPKTELIMGEASRVLYTLDGLDSNAISMEYAFFKPLNSKQTLEPYQIKFNEIVYENAMWETLSGFDEELMNASYSASFFQDRLNTVAAIYTSEQEYNEHSNMWDLLTHVEVTDFEHHIALTISNYSYTGGAHGGSNIVHYLIDRTSGELLELEDLFTDLDAVNTIAEVHFREVMELSEEDALDEEDFWFPEDIFSVNENFTIEGNSIVFDFNEYEIAPYCYGRTELAIPLNELTLYMTEYLHDTVD